MQTKSKNEIQAKRTKNKENGARQPGMHDTDGADNKDEANNNCIQTNNRYNYLKTQEEHAEDKRTERQK